MARNDLIFREYVFRTDIDEEEFVGLIREHFLEEGGVNKIAALTGISKQYIYAIARRIGVRRENQRKVKEFERKPKRNDFRILRTGKCPGNGKGCGSPLKALEKTNDRCYIATCFNGHTFSYFT
jgi:hypothetical protein